MNTGIPPQIDWWQRSEALKVAMDEISENRQPRRSERLKWMLIMAMAIVMVVVLL